MVQPVYTSSLTTYLSTKIIQKNALAHADPHAGLIIESPSNSPEGDSPQDNPGTGSTKIPETPSGELEDASQVHSTGDHEDTTQYFPPK